MFYFQQRDVIETTTKEFITNEQVTSMVTQDVTDKTFIENVELPKGPNDSTSKKPSQKPGYPRGTPGQRDDEKPKSIPAAGKPSRPQQTNEPKKITNNRPKSPEKTQDNVTPEKLIKKPNERSVSPEKNRPAAGKPSRISERPDKKKTPEKNDKKPKQNDLSPDDAPDKSLPVDVVKNIPPKEQCICELCTCG